MIEKNEIAKFIYDGDFSQEKIDELLDNSCSNERQLVKRTFKFLNDKIGVIENNAFFERIITNAVELLNTLCINIEFNEEEVTVNRLRIKKSREALLANANRLKNDAFMQAANRLDEIVLDKNVDVRDLTDLLVKLIERKEDINIIKKLLNTNKGVILSEDNILFSYVFDLALKSLQDRSPDIYYYISLLKVFYSSGIDKKSYIERLNAVSDESNPFANEIYLIIMGNKRGLKPDEIFDKYGIIQNLTTPPFIFIPNDSYYDELILTMDGETTQVRDDAISIRREKDDYVLGIHVADQTSAVRIGSEEDINARNNYKAIYTEGKGVRIFSRDIERAFSLEENEARPTLSMYVTIDQNGNIKDYYITENVIRVTNNLTYDNCDQLLIGGDPTITKTLRDLYTVACRLEQHNLKKKSYWYKKDTSSFERKLNDSKSAMINAELMVLFNRLIATIMCNESNPFVYRIQDPSYIKKLIRQLDIELDDEAQKVVNNIYMNSKYSSIPRYHCGLHVPIYSHTTDMLRRYPDFYNLCLIHKFYFGDINMPFDNDEFEQYVQYFNQRNVELSLMKSEYERALKLEKQ